MSAHGGSNGRDANASKINSRNNPLKLQVWGPGKAGGGGCSYQLLCFFPRNKLCLWLVASSAFRVLSAFWGPLTPPGPGVGPMFCSLELSASPAPELPSLLGRGLRRSHSLLSLGRLTLFQALSLGCPKMMFPYTKAWLSPCRHCVSALSPTLLCLWCLLFSEIALFVDLFTSFFIARVPGLELEFRGCVFLILFFSPWSQ